MTLYELLYAIHPRYGTNDHRIEHRVDYLPWPLCDGHGSAGRMGQLVRLIPLASAARRWYEDEDCVPPLGALPLWQVNWASSAVSHHFWASGGLGRGGAAELTAAWL